MDTIFHDYIDPLWKLDINDLYEKDFLHTRDKSKDELTAVLSVANALRYLRTQNMSARIFDSGLGISMFRDASTRTRFSYTCACNLLGLSVTEFDEEKCHISHGESLRETVNMISFMADVIGIRDDMYVGKGSRFMQEVSHAVKEGYDAGILEQRPMLINLQCDEDHPTQSMTDLMHMANEFGGIDNLKGKKVAVTWGYSPSFGKPLSVPQGAISLFTRFGMDVTLAHPEGYDLMPEAESTAMEFAKTSGGSFRKVESMEEAYRDADVVITKNWAPFSAMQERARLYGLHSGSALDVLEQELIAQNAQYKDWECCQKLMEITKGGNALYMHCLPADISDVSCIRGEVTKQVFDKYRTLLYKEASFKPYVIAAMILLGKTKNPQRTMLGLWESGIDRRPPYSL